MITHLEYLRIVNGVCNRRACAMLGGIYHA